MTEDKREGDELFEDLDKFFAPIKDVDWDEPEEAGSGRPSEEHVAVRADAPSEGASDALEDDDDEAWYDTTMLEPVSGLMDDDDGLSQPETVRILDADEVAGPPDDIDQGDLFSPEPSPVPATSMDPSDEDLQAAAEHFAGSLRSEQYDTAPIAGYDLDDGGADEERGDLLSDLGAEEVEHDILSDLHEPAEASRTVVVGAEGISGPSWQEPAAVEVGADLERRGPNPGERDVPAAFMTGLILAGVALASRPKRVAGGLEPARPMTLEPVCEPAATR